MLILLQKLEGDGASVDNLTTLIIFSLSVKGGLTIDAISTKLICFGDDGVATFQDHKIGVEPPNKFRVPIPLL